MIRAVLAGEAAAFEPLIRRHQNAIYGYLYRLLNQDRETARDLTQAAFLKAYRHLAGVDPGRPFRTWLYRVAHNEAVSWLRRSGVRGEVGLTAATAGRLRDEERPSPEAAAVAADQSRTMREALARLPERDRTVLTLHYFEERSYQEIAEILRTRPNTVATWLHRARDKLSALLDAAP